jgi:hypothetical protein
VKLRQQKKHKALKKAAVGIPLASVRQLLHPKEFRIEETGIQSESLAALVSLAQEIRSRKTPPTVESVPLNDLAGLFSSSGTNLWRLRKKMLDPGTGQPLEAMRRVYRHLESMWDAFGDSGIKIQDHDGEAVPEGGIYALKVIAFQPTAGLQRQQVIETIKPTIYYKERMIQRGEVIVGTPVLAVP